MHMELGDDATYPMRGVYSIYFICLGVMLLSWINLVLMDLMILLQLT
jgi:hypothetical protein